MLTIKNSTCVLLLFLVSGCADSKKSASNTPRPNYIPKDSWESDTPFVLPVQKHPTTVAADATELADDAPVIGVSAGTKHRAYSLKAMTRVTSHVLNDLIDGVPVTVTFCDRTDMSRCFTQTESKWPLELQLGGWKDQKILFKLHDQYYAHDAKDIPLKDYEFEKTTWGEWRQAHPDTDVFDTPPPLPGEEPPPMKRIATPKKIDESASVGKDKSEEDNEASDNSKSSENTESKDGQ